MTLITNDLNLVFRVLKIHNILHWLSKIQHSYRSPTIYLTLDIDAKKVIVFSSPSNHKCKYRIEKGIYIELSMSYWSFTNVSSTATTRDGGTFGKPTCSCTALHYENEQLWISIFFHHTKSYILMTWATELCKMWDVVFSKWCCEGFTLTLA